MMQKMEEGVAIEASDTCSKIQQKYSQNFSRIGSNLTIVENTTI
jgi:hypothetical protein